MARGWCFWEGNKKWWLFLFIVCFPPFPTENVYKRNWTPSPHVLLCVWNALCMYKSSFMHLILEIKTECKLPSLSSPVIGQNSCWHTNCASTPVIVSASQICSATQIKLSETKWELSLIIMLPPNHVKYEYCKDLKETSIINNVNILHWDIKSKVSAYLVIHANPILIFFFCRQFSE